MLSRLHLDFWNNPLVVSAMRLKYRKSSPGIMASLWILALTGIAAIVHQVGGRAPDFRFPTALLLILLSIQFVISAIIAVASTSSSMNAEVLNRTLDFQRIVSLSPQAILVGKMIGEPAISYFLAMASIPLAALCWALGAASGAVIFWFYVNIATFTLTFAALGLLHNLTPPSQPSGRQRSGGGLAFLVLFIFVPHLITMGVGLLHVPGVGDAVQLLSPLGSLMHLWKDSAWYAEVTFWGVSMPSLIAAPIAQLAMAAWVVAAMTRRLKNPINPGVTKLRCYAAVAAVDLLMTAVCYAQWRKGTPGNELVYAYYLLHIGVCVLFSLGATPRRPALIGWIWRGGRSQPRFRQLLLADRADMRLASVVLALIGPAVLGVGLLLPVALTSAAPGGTPFMAQNQLIEATLGAVVVVPAILLTLQAILAATSRAGALLFLLFLLLANVVPPLVSALLTLPQISASEELIDAVGSLSPVAYYIRNIGRFSAPIPVTWLATAYGFLALACYSMTERILRRQSRMVAFKLDKMGVAQ